MARESPTKLNVGSSASCDGRGKMERDGHDVCRMQFLPEGEAALLFSDLFDKTTNTLYEAKGTVTRPAFRMAISQLADYARMVDPRPES